MAVDDLERAVAALALDHQVLTPAEAIRVIATARNSDRSLAAVLVDAVGETALLEAVAAELDLPWVDLYATGNAYRVDETLARLCDIDMLKAHNALPLRGPGDQIAVAMANPRADQDMVDYLRSRLPDNPTLVLAPTSQIQAKLVYFDTADYADEPDEPDEAATAALPTTVTDNPIVEWVDNLLARAAAENASDVHFKFEADGTLLVRFRVDGVLRRQAVPLRRREREIVGTLLSKCPTIDASDRTRPQDGTFSFAAVNGRQIDVRLGMLPQAYGPTVVCRLLDPANINRKLDDMGFSRATLEQMRRVVRSPQGAVFAIGPTGSGKRLTLSTPVPTPTGMTTMGELNVGDLVLGRDGRPCRVTGLSPVETAPDLYRVRFSDGQEVLADGEHQWLVSTHHGRSVPRTKKRRAAIARHRSAHLDADALDALALSWSGAGHVTAAELFDILAQGSLTAEIPSPAGVRAALSATDCPRHYASRRRAAGAFPASPVVEYPTEIALKSLAMRLRERFHTAPSATASLSRMTTEELLATGLRLRGGHRNFAVPVTAPVDLPEADLPVDPYLFGYWLGDGTAAAGHITVGSEDLEFARTTLGEILPVTAEREDEGVYRLTFGRVSTDCVRGHDDWRRTRTQQYCKTCRGAGVGDPVVNVSLHTELAALGVLGAKHIPTVYLRSSRSQRLALLQGLMDTDGSIDGNGACELSLSDRRLAADSLDLIRSLGIKASVSWDQPTSYVRADGTTVEGRLRHRIHFTTTQPVFRLPRKAGRLPHRVRETQNWLYITDISPVGAADSDYGPARCISVDSSDHTYLCGTGYVVTSNTTTLYGLLKELPALDLNILTAEDPIEYRLPYIGQTQIRGDLGEKSLTFAKTLRSMLRLDPDVILVGEVRDNETAKMALDAAISGHLVLSTLHAKSSIGAYSRLEELGADPLLSSESLSLAVNQRLIRKVHDCATFEAPNGGEVAFLARHGLEVPDRVARVGKSGCGGCNGTGYRGRIAVVEVLEPSAEVRTMVAERRAPNEILRAAQGEGYTSILSDAHRHVAEGRSTVAELLRCIDTGGI